jgi:uncharacterized protein
MFLNIKEMELRRIRFDEDFEPGEIDFLGTGLRQATAIHAEGSAKVLENSGGEVRIEGRFSAVMETDCDRCLAMASLPLDKSFDLFYRPPPIIAEDEVKIDEGEAEIGFYEGLGLELADVIKEQILLATPMQRVCSEDCKGMCPVCGADRNQVVCDCHEQPADDRWKALKDLVEPDVK